jgi:enoyl-CoA hydratase/carnithine racemase
MTILIERDGAIASVVLNRPEAGNRLDAATLDALRDALTELAAVDTPSVVVLRAVGADFSLGRQASDIAPTPSAITAEFERVQAVNDLLQWFPTVTIAALKGEARGAGLSLAGRCDLVVAGEGTRLSFPEVQHDIPPTIVLSPYRYVLPRKVLYDLVLTGRVLSAEEGVAAGLVSRVVPDIALEESAMELAGQIAKYDERTLRTIKRFMRRTEGMNPNDAPPYGIATFANEMSDRSYPG